jgi:hypothetical protein
MKTYIINLIVCLAIFFKGIKNEQNLTARILAIFLVFIFIDLAARWLRYLIKSNISGAGKVQSCILFVLLMSLLSYWIAIDYLSIRETTHQLGVALETSFLWWRSRPSWWLLGILIELITLGHFWIWGRRGNDVN